MKDVANRAGVSVATVSNVLNNISNKTTEETRVKVLKAVEELNYKLDMTARALSSGKSNLIGLFFPKHLVNGKKISVLRENPFYMEAFSGIENGLSEMEFQLLVASIEEPEEALDLIRKRMLDVVVVFGMRGDTFWSAVKKAGIPFVSVDAHTEDATVNIEMDNEYAGYIATKHLIDLGHRKIAFCNRFLDETDLIYIRYQGFMKAIEEAGIPKEDCPIIECEVNIKGGENAASILLSKYNDVTAVFTAADIIAFGIIKYYQTQRKRIPNDLSVIGFDNLAACDYIYPSVTTIKQDIYEKGLKIANVVADLSKGNPIDKNYMLPVTLIVRESTKKMC